MQERLSQIVALVEEHQKMSVKDLSACLNVSEVTIRKDLNALEDGGVLTREHGYAVKKDAADIRNRMSISYDTKISIAQEALALVDDNETVMIGSGSPALSSPKALAQSISPT
jgi:DeoR/GlpR family transcriptional regulator of sugar metabolism